jgi:hypothetical protein
VRQFNGISLSEVLKAPIMEMARGERIRTCEAAKKLLEK